MFHLSDNTDHLTNEEYNLWWKLLGNFCLFLAWTSETTCSSGFREMKCPTAEEMTIPAFYYSALFFPLVLFDPHSDYLRLRKPGEKVFFSNNQHTCKPGHLSSNSSLPTWKYVNPSIIQCLFHFPPNESMFFEFDFIGAFKTA